MIADDDAYHYYPADQGHGLTRNPLKAIIAPRPIAWVSTLSAEGVGNLAPYSFFNQISDSPPMLMFSSVGRKDTVTNVAATGEFAVSLVSHAVADAMNTTSGAFPPEVDEFDAAGLARMPCRAIRPPAVAGSPAVLECRAVDVRQLSSLDGAAIDVWMVIGQIVGVHVARSCLADGLFRTERANPVLRGGYADEYWSIGDAGRFGMRR
ncbi:MAG: flavin reductase family protein [Sphingomonadales bacterium]|nr:flavin reductase family protein [Sphingomonadales bacterium]